MKLDDWLAKRAQSCPDRMALSADGMDVSYSELEAEATWVARRLAAHGVRRGSKVAITARGSREPAVILHGLMKLGAVTIPLSPKMTEPDRISLLEGRSELVDLGDGALLTQSEADLPLLGEHDLSDPACQILTSGSTSTARTVELTYGNHLWSAVGAAFNLGVLPDDRWLCCLPLSHIAGFSILTRAAVYGIGVIVHDGFDVDAVAAELEQGRASVISLVPTMLIRLLEAGVDLSRARAILVGGGPVPAGVLDEALAKGAPVSQTYGLTESCSQVTTLAAADARRKNGSAGRPLLTTHLRIENGEILVQGPTVAPGSVDDDGWLHTGDLGHIDEEGFLWVRDRIDDLIITGGENVVPSEVEAVLSEHPAVLEAAVIGREDPEWQQAVTAVVVLRDGNRADADAIREHCAGKLPGHKVPKRVEFASSLPRTSSGKLWRRELR